MEPQSELEKNALKIKLANAGFRSESAAAVYQGIRVVCLVVFLLPALFFFLLKDGFTMKSIQWTVILGGHRLLPAADRPVVPADDAAEGDLPDPARRPGPAGGVRRVRPGSGRGHAEGDRRDEGPREDHLRGVRRWRTSSCRWAGRGARCCTTSACGPAWTTCAAWRRS